jgi:hypothetical protein
MAWLRSKVTGALFQYTDYLYNRGDMEVVEDHYVQITPDGARVIEPKPEPESEPERPNKVPSTLVNLLSDEEENKEPAPPPSTHPAKKKVFTRRPPPRD